MRKELVIGILSLLLLIGIVSAVKYSLVDDSGKVVGNVNINDGKSWITGNAVNGNIITGRAATLPSSILNGIVAHYRFDGSGSDDSGRRNNALAFGSPQYSTEGLVKSANLNGNSWFSAARSSSLDLYNSFSIGIWVKGNSNGQRIPTLIVSKAGVYSLGVINTTIGSTPELYFLLNTTNSNGRQGVMAYYSSGGKNVLDGNWHYLVVIVDKPNQKVKLFVDGVLAKETINPTLVVRPTTRNNNRIIIGGNGLSGNKRGNFKGLIEETTFWNRALSNNEVKQTYDYYVALITEILNTPRTFEKCIENGYEGGYPCPDGYHVSSSKSWKGCGGNEDFINITCQEDKGPSFLVCNVGDSIYRGRYDSYGCPPGYHTTFMGRHCEGLYDSPVRRCEINTPDQEFTTCDWFCPLGYHVTKIRKEEGCNLLRDNKKYCAKNTDSFVACSCPDGYCVTKTEGGSNNCNANGELYLQVTCARAPNPACPTSAPTPTQAPAAAPAPVAQSATVSAPVLDTYKEVCGGPCPSGYHSNMIVRQGCEEGKKLWYCTLNSYAPTESFFSTCDTSCPQGYWESNVLYPSAMNDRGCGGNNARDCTKRT